MSSPGDQKALAVPGNLYTSQLSPADRDFISQKTAAVRFCARRSAEDVIAIGVHLNEVRERLGPSVWQNWVAAEFAWSRETARRFGLVASSFVAHAACIARFDPSALYLLAQPNTPQEARRLALLDAESGHRITNQAARAIIASCRGTTPTEEELEEVAAARRAVGLTESKTPAAIVSFPAWDALLNLVETSRSIRISSHEDASNDSRYTITVHRDGDDGPEIIDHTSDNLAELAITAAGREPTRVCNVKTCKHVGTPQPLFSSFSRNRSKKDGRATACRDCERRRVKATKRKQRAAKPR